MNKNKKAGLEDLFVFMIVIFVLVIFCVLFFYIGNTVYDKILLQNQTIQGSTPVTGAGTNVTETIQNTLGKVPTAYESLKWITVMLIIGYIISLIVTSYMVQTKPVFFVAYLLIVIIAIIVSVPMSNTYETIYQNPTLASSFSGFWGANWIFLHLPIWILVIGIISGIIMYVNLIRGQSEYP